MRIESNGEPMRDGRPVVSSAGAMGLMQLMPGTWRELRAQLGLGFDPFEPRDNILAGAAYLRLMYDRFGYPGLFASYNAGPGRYAAALSGRRIIPAETRAYLARVNIRMPAAQVVRTPTPALFALRAGDASARDRAAPVSSRPTGELFVPLSAAAGR